MHRKPHRFNLRALVGAVLAWIAETTQESRAARLSTLGVSDCSRNGTCADDPSGGHRFR